MSHEARFHRVEFEPAADTPQQYEEWTIRSDEPALIGGDNEHPTPMHYFVAGLGLCLLTQLFRYSKMLKIDVDDAQVRVQMHWRTRGSVLKDTVKVDCTGVELEIDIVSDEREEQIVRLVRAAREGCYGEAALAGPITAIGTLTLNGRQRDVDVAPRFGQTEAVPV